jgi:hypothetical protein
VLTALPCSAVSLAPACALTYPHAAAPATSVMEMARMAPITSDAARRLRLGP